jgi:hypothetical protein
MAIRDISIQLSRAGVDFSAGMIAPNITRARVDR